MKVIVDVLASIAEQLLSARNFPVLAPLPLIVVIAVIIVGHFLLREHSTA